MDNQIFNSKNLRRRRESFLLRSFVYCSLFWSEPLRSWRRGWFYNIDIIVYAASVAQWCSSGAAARLVCCLYSGASHWSGAAGSVLTQAIGAGAETWSRLAWHGSQHPVAHQPPHLRRSCSPSIRTMDIVKCVAEFSFVIWESNQIFLQCTTG